MREELRHLDYERLAQKAIEKNLGYLLKRMARPGEIFDIERVPIPISNSGEKQTRGTTYCKRKRKWQAQKIVNGKTIFLGYFKTESEAHNVFMNYLKNLQQKAA